MPQVLECEDTALNAGCFATLADALVGAAGTKPNGERRDYLVKANGFLTRASEEYARLGDDDSRQTMSAKKARIMHYLGDKSTRDEAVKMYTGLGRERA